jgi:hypothetical protein
MRYRIAHPHTVELEPFLLEKKVKEINTIEVLEESER